MPKTRTKYRVVCKCGLTTDWYYQPNSPWKEMLRRGSEHINPSDNGHSQRLQSRPETRREQL